MSLLFGANTNDRVLLAAGNDNQHTFTVLQWIYRTADTNFRRLWHKGSPGDAKSFINWSTFANDARFAVKRATTDAAAATAASALPQNQWLFVATTYDATDGPRIFVGTLTTTVAEVSYASRVVGSGAESSDSDSAWSFGADPTTNGSQFEGRQAIAAHYRRRFSLAELKAYQFTPRNDADCDILLHVHGTGTQPNLSTLGRGLNGSVTGATVAPHVPLGSPFGADEWEPYVVSAPAATRSSRLSLLGVS